MALSWYVNRLRTMSAPEVAFRFGQYLQKKREKRTQIGIFPTVALKALPTKVLPVGSFSQKIDKPVLSLFGIEFNYSQPIDWHLDISSKRRFPEVFAKDIDIRTEQYGSAKHVWEVNRMQFLTLIALQYRKTGDLKYIRQFQNIIASWIESNPYLTGVNWYSNIEVNIRLIVWFFCWEILDVNALMKEDQAFKDFVENQWIPLIYLHCKYSYENPSKFSSANNHLVSEYAGLFIGASFWPFEESSTWKAYAREGLEREIQLQHSPNGVNKEEAAEYIQFITDFFLFAYVVDLNVEKTFSEAYRQQLENIIEYIFQLMDVKGNIPYYGDEDDGKVCVFSPDPHFDNFRSLLASGVVLFNNPSWKTKSLGFDTKNNVLFGERGKRTFENMLSSYTDYQSRFYVEEGHFMMRKQQGEKEVYVHFDAAPLGFLSIAAHGHADALSFVMHIDGHPVITDAGTYTYHTERTWRNYFISTLAHNTVTVDQTDQARSTGPTMWMDHYQCQVLFHESHPDKDTVSATHNGYEKLGVTHQREVVLDKKREKLIITDQIFVKNKRQHLLEIPLHLHPAVAVEQADNHNFILKAQGARHVHLKTDHALEVTLVKGQTQPILGWFSPSFQIKEPATVIYGKVLIEKTTTFVTEITVVNSDI